VFIFTGYLDESGTHDGSPATVMGGLLARAEQWERWEKGFTRLQEKHGFQVWHSKKFKKKNGDFKGWSQEQCLALYSDLTHLNARGLTEAMAVTLNNADYEKHYRNGPKSNRARLDSKYGLCFRICLYHFVRLVFQRRHRKKVPLLHIVLEAGHNNYGDAERIFLEVKKDFEKHGNYMLGTITKAAKDSCGQLMMADFAAHGEYVVGRHIADSERQKLPPSTKIPKGMTGWTNIRPTAEELAKERADRIKKATPKRTNSRPSKTADASEEQPS